MSIAKIFKIIYYIVIAFIGMIAILLVVSVFPITGNFKVMIVQSGSIQSEIKMGSIVAVKPAHSTGSGQADYKIGDVITFQVVKNKEPGSFGVKGVKGLPRRENLTGAL